MIDLTLLQALAEQTGYPRVSIFMPTHRYGRETRQGPIRLSNLLREAAQALGERGMPSEGIDEFFASVRRHTHSEVDPFWQHQDLGLAIFVSSEDTSFVQVSIPLEESVYVGQHFLIRPLLPTLAREGTFHVLSVSQDIVTLYEASRFGMTARQDDRLPDSAAVKRAREEARHAREPSGTQSGEPPAEEPVGRLQDFALDVAKATDAILANEHGPLVIAADDRLLGMLRKELRYGNIADPGLREHPRAMSEEDLHARAWEMVRDSLDADRQAVLERFEARRGAADSRGFSTRIEDIVPAAAQGRIEALIVSPDEAAEGIFVPGNARAIVARTENEKTIDLVDYAVVKTIATGGAVYTRPMDRADSFPPLAAIYRY